MEIKQLKYFVVAADIGSFSEAAKILYTTQSSVSKVIGALEEELGYSLFKRVGKGIALTEEGSRFHIKASKLVADFQELENESQKDTKNMIKISMNHSSWLANCFSDFYESHKDDNNCYCIHADTTSNIIKRIRLMEDEVGFIYVFPETKLQFEYELKIYNLRFEKLKSVDGMIYFQPDDSVKNNISVDNVHDLKFIQSERDEYLQYGTWFTEEGEEVNIKDEIAVITNSDYVMHALLERNDLANLSADSFNSFDMGIRPGLRLKNCGGVIEFGVLSNLVGNISEESKAFINFIRDELPL